MRFRINRGIFCNDCFQNPCFYLGRFTPQMGSLGDVESTEGVFTYIANLFNSEKIKKERLKAIIKLKRETNEITQEEHDKILKEIETASKSTDVSSAYKHIFPQP